MYYSIMIIDPILRCAWIFYAIFTHDAQHSTIVSFMVAFMEVTRRGMWALFRVENEHCSNVSQYKASRDVPLPYLIEPLMTRASTGGSTAEPPRENTAERPSTEDPSRHGTATSTAVSSNAIEEGMARRRAGAPTPRRNFSRILAEAHKQDFEKRRRPEVQTDDTHSAELGQSDDDDDDDDVGEAADLLEVREAEELAREPGAGASRGV